MQWKKCIIGVKKCVAAINYARSQFWRYILMLLEKLQLKLQKFIIYSYKIGIIHILVP